MSVLYYLVWLVAFVAGVVLSFAAPESALSVGVKFIFVGVWGAVLGFIFFIVAKRAVQDSEAGEAEAPDSRPVTELVPVVPSDVAEGAEQGDVPAEGTVPEAQSEETALPEATPTLESAREIFPLSDWDDFCKEILRNRPFSEVVGALEKVLP